MRLKSTSILKHLSHKSKSSNCISMYTEEELHLLREKAKKRKKFKIKKWLVKNRNHRKIHYENNKTEIAKKKSEYYRKNKDKLLKKQLEYDSKKKEKKAQYYKKKRIKIKYSRMFSYQLRNGHSYNRIATGFFNKCVDTEFKLKDMMKILKEKQPPHKLKKKTLKFLDEEVDSIDSFLKREIDCISKKCNYYGDKQISLRWTREYDKDAAFDFIVTIQWLMDELLDQLEILLDSFIQNDMEKPSCMKKKYLKKKLVTMKEYDEERSRIEENNIERAKMKLKETVSGVCKESCMETISYSSILRRSKNTIKFFKQQEEIPLAVIQRLSRLSASIDKKITELQSEIDEVTMEINETICHWNNKMWKKNESSDIIFYTDMFENLKRHLKYEQKLLEHKVQQKLKEISREIELTPPKPFIQEFFKCFDPKCRCFEFKDVEVE